jgi:hypothetical protein
MPSIIAAEKLKKIFLSLFTTASSMVTSIGYFCTLPALTREAGKYYHKRRA